MSSIEKHIEFVSNRIGDKCVSTINGIDDDTKMKLNDMGYSKAYELLAKFLSPSGNKSQTESEAFDEWLQNEIYTMSSKQRKECIDCLAEWCENNL